MNIKITKDICQETYEIVNSLGDDYIKKIPSPIWNYIIKNKSGTEIKEISREALILIGCLHYKYLTDSKEEKRNLMEIFKLNENEYQIELQEKYANELLKKDSIINKNVEKNVEIVEYKENYFKKLVNFIKKIFNK